MRFPQKPPSAEGLITRDPKRLMLCLSRAEDEAKRTDRYLHWDELRHRTPPEGLTAEEWWVGLKLRRMAQQQEIPLLDGNGRAFVFSLTSRLFERLHDVDLRCGGTVEGPEPVTNPETRDRYCISSLIEEAITSSQLEGAAVTRMVAKEMLRTGRKPTDGGERMIVNNFLTMQKLAGWKQEDLTPALVMKIHGMITRGTLEEAGQEGRLRTADDDVRVEDEQIGEVVHVPPPADQLEQRMAAMCEFANERQIQGFLHPVVRSILLHFWLAYDHPFVDGNGRTARALFYWSMLRQGFWLFEFISISQRLLASPAKYYRAFLHTETDGNDLNYFLLHQVEVIQQAIGDLHAYIQRKAEEMKEMQRLLGKLRRFNHRQVALLKHALQHPETEFTVTSHQNSHGVVTQTARTDLEALTQRGLLAKQRAGKAFIYQAEPELDLKLRNLQ